MDDFERALLKASITQAAEDNGILVNKAGETPTNPPMPTGLEEAMLRGLLGLDVEEEITDEHREVYRIFYAHMASLPE